MCSGGTFLEIAFAQSRVREFMDGARDLGLAMVEVSNGVHPMSEAEKLRLIGCARSAGFTVWSEVGRKDPDEDARMGIDQRAIERELEAGRTRSSSRRANRERSESTTAAAPVEMIQRIVERIGQERLVFEAPRKDQQLWMVRMLGPQALGLATLRTGLRGDTFREMHLHGLEIFLGEGVHGALEARERGGVIVMIDALRASATMIAALEAGMAAIRPVASPEECSGEVTAGERGGRKLPNCRHNSSPTELMRYSYPARPWSSPRPTGSSACSARPGRRASCSSARPSTGARSPAPPEGAAQARRADHAPHGGAEQPVRDRGRARRRRDRARAAGSAAAR